MDVRRQSGLSLVEVLISVSILSFITLTVMGYFIQSVESSAEDSRRIVAVKLAKQKIEQIRSEWKTKSSTLEKLDLFRATKANERKMLVSNISISNDNRDLQLLQDIGLKSLLTSERNLNNIDYHYLLELSADVQNEYADQFQQFTRGSSANTPSSYMMKIRVTVYWGEETANEPARKTSTYLDSYIRFDK